DRPGPRLRGQLLAARPVTPPCAARKAPFPARARGHRRWTGRRSARTSSSFLVRYLDTHEDVRAIANHPPEPLRGGRAPHPPALDDHLLHRGIELARIDKPHPSFDRRTPSRDRQARPGIAAPARHAKRVGVIEEVDLAIGHDEPSPDGSFAPVFTRADQ